MLIKCSPKILVTFGLFRKITLCETAVASIWATFGLLCNSNLRSHLTSTNPTVEKANDGLATNECIQGDQN